jgi:general secretion pathway protein C
LVAALLALAAYFQASGAVELAAASAFSVQPDQLTAPQRKRGSRRRQPRARPQSPNGNAILARNPFDSVTGPLDRKPIELELPEATTAVVETPDPLSAPKCTDVVLNIVSESPDPEWSLAQLRGPGDADASVRRVGDQVGNLTVAYIGFNAMQASPAVWLVGDGTLCQALLFTDDKAAATPSAPAPKPRASTKSSAASRRKGGAPKVPEEIADKIQQVSETEFNVDRGVIDNILENQAQLMRSARIVPEQKDGKTVGIRLFGIRSDTLLGTLGMQNGDRLEKINGFDMASPEKALEAYARLRTATNLTVQLTRRGNPLTIEYQIK